MNPLNNEKPESAESVALPNHPFRVSENGIKVTLVCQVIGAIEEAMKIPYRKERIVDVQRKIFSLGHWSLLEHSSITLKIEGISRATSHQLVRQRIGVTFTQESQRYTQVEVNPAGWYVTPPRIPPQALERYFEFMEQASNLYQELLELGVRKEDARYVLPNATKTNIMTTWNLSSLVWFFEQRKAKAAQWEIRELANCIYNLIMEELPSWSEFLQFWSLGTRH